MGLLSYSDQSGGGLLGGPINYASQATAAVNAITPPAPPPQPHHSFLGRLANGFSNFASSGAMDQLAAAQAFLSGHPEQAYAMLGQAQDRRLERQKLSAALQLQAEQQGRLNAAYAAIDADPNMTDEEKAVAKASFDKFSERFNERFGTFNQAPDSRIAVAQGGGKYQTFAGPESYREVDGIIYKGKTPVAESPYPRIIPGQNGAFFNQPRIGIGGLTGGQAAPQGTVQGSASTGEPPAASISFLTQHPETAPHFDERYGSGSASKYLGGAGQGGPQTFPYGQ